ncbi:MAG: hypothetical protein K2I81_02080 [Alphaproteobacteria bacterium]|nr:hypothetical protein [Alphaproteobacteria bacterium]
MDVKVCIVGCIFGLLAMPVFAETYTMSQADYIGADGFVGQTCSDGGKIIIKCACASPQIGITVECVSYQTMPSAGCRLSGGDNLNTTYYCVAASAGQACHMCKCNNNQTYTAWTTGSSNRVSRTKYSTQDNNYTCTSTSSTEYGCAAGYYTTATAASASMTCSLCPASGGKNGTSTIGNTAITGCYMPANTALSDTSGNYTYTSNCYYTK